MTSFDRNRLICDWIQRSLRPGRWSGAPLFLNVVEENESLDSQEAIDAACERVLEEQRILHILKGQ